MHGSAVESRWRDSQNPDVLASGFFLSCPLFFTPNLFHPHTARIGTPPLPVLPRTRKIFLSSASSVRCPFRPAPTAICAVLGISPYHPVLPDVLQGRFDCVSVSSVCFVSLSVPFFVSILPDKLLLVPLLLSSSLCTSLSSLTDNSASLKEACLRWCSSTAPCGVLT